MKRPASYKWVCIAVTVYALLVTVPSAIAVYWSAGDILLVRSNAFAVLPPSGWRTMAVASLVIHQVRCANSPASKTSHNTINTQLF